MIQEADTKRNGCAGCGPPSYYKLGSVGGSEYPNIIHLEVHPIAVFAWTNEIWWENLGIDSLAKNNVHGCRRHVHLSSFDSKVLFGIHKEVQPVIVPFHGVDVPTHLPIIV